MARPGRWRGARRLRLPHGDHPSRRGHLRRHGADGRRGHLHLQGLPGLPRRAHGHRRPVPARPRVHARPGRAHHGPLRERLGHRRARGACAGRGPDRPHPPRAYPPGGARGRGDPSLGAPRGARRRRRLHRARDLRPGRRRDRRRPGARRGRVRRDLPAVPDQHRRRPGAARLRRSPLRVLAAPARGPQPGAAVGGARPRSAGERVHRPLSRSTASRRRSGATTSRRSPTGWR